jgi:hypothetical protein
MTLSRVRRGPRESVYWLIDQDHKLVAGEFSYATAVRFVVDTASRGVCEVHHYDGMQLTFEEKDLARLAAKLELKGVEAMEVAC